MSKNDWHEYNLSKKSVRIKKNVRDTFWSFRRITQFLTSAQFFVTWWSKSYRRHPTTCCKHFYGLSCYAVSWLPWIPDILHQRQAKLQLRRKQPLSLQQRVLWWHPWSSWQSNKILKEAGITEGGTEGSDDADAVTTPWKWKFFLDYTSILQLIACCVGFFGNLLVVMVMTLRKANNNSTDILFTALAVADLLTSVAMVPVPKAIQVPDNLIGTIYCKLITDFYLYDMSIIASTYILLGICIERMVAVLYPLRLKVIFTKKRVYCYIGIAWVVGCAANGYQFISRSDGQECIDNITQVGSMILSVSMVSLRLLIPVLIMVISQTVLIISLHRQAKNIKRITASKQSSFHGVVRDRVIKMTFIVIAIFIISWAPRQLIWLVYAVGIVSGGPPKQSLRRTMKLITYLNNVANPFIYTIHSPKFRSAVIQIFTKMTEKRLPIFGMEIDASTSNHTPKLTNTTTNDSK